MLRHPRLSTAFAPVKHGLDINRYKIIHLFFCGMSIDENNHNSELTGFNISNVFSRKLKCK